MGCQESRTIEGQNRMPSSDQKMNGEGQTNSGFGGVLLNTITGLLEKDLGFQDTIAMNQNEFEDNMRIFIPTQIQDPLNPNQIKPNLEDVIVTESIKIDFSKNYVIAVNGLNSVTDVQYENDKYIIYHDNISGSCSKYIALLVQRKEGAKGFEFKTPKPPSSD